MMLWFVLAAVTVGVLAALVAPLFRQHRPSPSRARGELAIYRDQLAELQRDVEAGRVSGSEAKLAETEIKRKILAGADAIDPSEAAAAVPARGWAVSVALGLIATVIPIGGLAVYLLVGSPGVPGFPFDPARASAE